MGKPRPDVDYLPLLTLPVWRIRFGRDGFRWAAAVPVHAAAVEGAPPAEPAVGLHPGGVGRAGDPLRQGRQHQMRRRRQPQPGIHRIREYHHHSLRPMLVSPTRLVQSPVTVDTVIIVNLDPALFWFTCSFFFLDHKQYEMKCNKEGVIYKHALAVHLVSWRKISSALPMLF